ncbi:flavin monoamine oxidase family protein [Laceyella putida]|uniref:Flavin monoamine oxidase family protein n=1 Tax=Laceyella putida TaxID=110101 RepID=A0ABW2RQ98_9BACL
MPLQLTPYQMVSIIQNGMNTPRQPKNIVVVGAGMAGLVAASLLKEAGHQVKMIEAANRVGGRVLTLRSPFTDGQYIEAGPMRIPSVHYLTLGYIRKFGLPINPFFNSTPNDILYVNGIKTRLKTYQRNPAMINANLAKNERGKTFVELLNFAFQPLYNFISQDPVRNWSMAIKELNKYSLDTFLRHNPFGDLRAIELAKMLTATEGLSELSFLDIFRQFVIFLNPHMRFYEITGGFDRLPRAFLPQLKEDILFQQEVRKIIQHDNKVIIRSVHTQTAKPFEITGDIAIITIPFSVLRFVEVEPYHSFSLNKWKAIRELHYVPSVKMGIQFKNRFWEREGMYGGQTISDLPVKQTYYPSHGFGEKCGVVLASYTWEDDAQVWDKMTQEAQIEYGLRDLAKIHDDGIIQNYVAGAVHSWVQQPYSAGSFALFKPEQEVELYPSILSPEGRVHFAGEHASTDRSWIQGAIASGIRVACEVNDLPK